MRDARFALLRGCSECLDSVLPLVLGAGQSRRKCGEGEVYGSMWAEGGRVQGGASPMADASSCRIMLCEKETGGQRGERWIRDPYLITLLGGKWLNWHSVLFPD